MGCVNSTVDQVNGPMDFNLDASWHMDLAELRALECNDKEMFDRYSSIVPPYGFPGTLIDCYGGKANTTVFIPFDGSVKPGQKVIIIVPLHSHPMSEPLDLKLLFKLSYPLGQAPPSIGIERWEALLAECMHTDLSDAIYLRCISQTYDSMGDPIISFFPEVGMAITKSMPKRYDYQFRLIMLLLLKTICEATIGNKQYSLVYANTDNIPTISKQSTLYTCWSVLPHNIRKSLKNLYVLHPDRGSGIDQFFTLCRPFISSKFGCKIVHLKSVKQLQEVFSHSLVPVPYQVINTEDEMLSLKPTGNLPSLIQSYNDGVKSTIMIDKCMTYIRNEGGLDRMGLFRIAGDDTILKIVKTRLQWGTHLDYANASTDKLQYMNDVMIGESDVINQCDSIINESSKDMLHQSMRAAIVVTDVDSVAQIMKYSIRELPQPLVVASVYPKVLALTKEYEEALKYDKLISVNEYINKFNILMNDMPYEHRETLATILAFLKEVADNSTVNGMDSKNLSIIFAPTIMPFTSSNATDALVELTLTQLALKALISGLACKDVLMSQLKDKMCDEAVVFKRY